MSQIIYNPKRMTIDEAIACKRDEKADKAYLEFFNVWVNGRD